MLCHSFAPGAWHAVSGNLEALQTTTPSSTGCMLSCTWCSHQCAPAFCADVFTLQAKWQTFTAGGNACIAAAAVLLSLQLLRMAHTVSHGCTMRTRSGHMLMDS